METTFIFGINLPVAVPRVQFGLQATRPLKDYLRNILLFFNTNFPIFPIFSILSFLFSFFFEQPFRWTP